MLYSKGDKKQFILELDKAEKGQVLAYLVWNAESLEELEHLRDVFDSCMRIRREQFRVMDEVMEKKELSVGFVLLEDKVVDLNER